LVRIENQFDFTDLDLLEMRWKIQAEGIDLISGTVSLPPTPPGENVDIDMQIPWTDEVKKQTAQSESFIFLEFKLVKELPWAPKGFTIGWEQLPLTSKKWTKVQPAATNIEWDEKPDGVRAICRSGGYEAVFSREGFLSSLIESDVERLASPLVMNLWRVPTENDGLKTFIDKLNKPGFSFYYQHKVMYAWLAAGLDELHFSLESLEIGGDGLRAAHKVLSRTGRDVGMIRQRWSFGPQGISASMEFDLVPSLPELPRVGLTCALPCGFERVRWYGRGPQECYSDRKTGAPFGLYAMDVSELGVPYIVPQENGNRTDVRWVEFSDPSRGARVRFQGDGFDFSASHYEPTQVWKALHQCELEPRREIFLNIDIAQRGLGTASCGPDTLEKYILRPQYYRFEFDMLL
jgi:beta-galactosidase